MKTKTAGFSIMELMIYLMVAGTLMALVLPQLRKALGMGRKFKAQSAMTNIQQALHEYDFHVGHFPTTREGLNALIDAPKSGAAGWQGPYLHNMNEPPLDPWGRDYVYNSPPLERKQQFRQYELISRGPTEDDPKDDIVVGE